MAYGIYLHGSFVVNGIIAGVAATDTSALLSFDHKLLVHGVVSILNTPVAPSVQREKQLTNLFGASWLSSFGSLVDLETVLAWRCLQSGQ